MTESTQTPAAPAAPVLPAFTVPAENTVTEREFLAAITGSNGKPLAVTQSKDGGPARGRFSTEAVAVLDAAKAQGFVPKAVKPAAKPRVAKTTAKPVSLVKESVAAAGARTPSPADLAPRPAAQPPVTRSEGQAWGFTRLLARGRKG